MAEREREHRERVLADMATIDRPRRLLVWGKDVAWAAEKVAAAARTWRMIGGFDFERAAGEHGLLMIRPGAPDRTRPEQRALPRDLYPLIEGIVRNHGLRCEVALDHRDIW